MQDRQDRIKGVNQADGAGGSFGGTLGRYVQHNAKQALQRPGMEQFAISIKTKHFKRDQADDEFLDGPCKGYQMSGQEVCFPKGVLLPECLRQQNAEQLQKAIADKNANSGCVICKGPTEAKKYKCSKSGQISCSFDCYKKV